MKGSLIIVGFFVLGFIIVIAYMACFGEAKAFIVSIMNSSGAVMKLWEIARGIIFPLLGKEVTPLGYPDASPVPFYIKLLDIFAYTGAVILFMVNVLLLVLHKAWHTLRPGCRWGLSPCIASGSRCSAPPLGPQ